MSGNQAPANCGFRELKRAKAFVLNGPVLRVVLNRESTVRSIR
jgi:hypothetical protein